MKTIYPSSWKSPLELFALQDKQQLDKNFCVYSFRLVCSVRPFFDIKFIPDKAPNFDINDSQIFQ